MAHFIKFYPFDDNPLYTLRTTRCTFLIGVTLIRARTGWSLIVWKWMTWYSVPTMTIWIMCSREKVFRHLPEHVKRQYKHVQDIPISPLCVCSWCCPGSSGFLGFPCAGHTLDIVGFDDGGSIAAHIRILGIVLSGEILLGQLMRTNHWAWPTSTYSISRTRKQLRRRRHGRDMAQCFIFVLTCTFM